MTAGWPYRISIHALREEGDLLRAALVVLTGDFYPRPPRGGRLTYKTAAFVWVKFLSTPSARRATAKGAKNEKPSGNFYPRPPRGGRRPGDVTNSIKSRISIHALREEGDAPLTSSGGRPSAFLSTPSARRATQTPYDQLGRAAISIHALREEGDWSGSG